MPPLLLLHVPSGSCDAAQRPNHRLTTHAVASLTLLVVFGLASGWSVLDTEERPDQLWVADG